MKFNASNNAETQLVEDITSTDTIIKVEDTSRFPEVPFLVSFDDEEVVEVIEVESNAFTVKRGQEETSSSDYQNGTEVKNTFTAGMYKGLAHKDEIPVRVTENDTFQYRNNAGEWVELKGGSSFKVGNVSDLSAEAKAGLTNEIKWKDPADIEVDGVKIATWAGTQLRAKKDSYPIDQNDGVLLEDVTTRDKYGITPFNHDKLTDGDKWHYMLFPYTDNGEFTVDSANRVNATAIEKLDRNAPTKATASNLKFDRATITSDSGAVVSINKSDWYSSPHTFTGLTEETNYTPYAKFEANATYYESPIKTGATFTTPSEAPGPGTIIDGDESAGFFGEVPANEFFTGSEIASACGISQGTLHNDNEPWLKYIIGGKICFRPRKSIRYGTSWDAINAANCVYGDSRGKIVTKDGMKFKVRLMKGALTDPSKYNENDRGAKGSEWNKIMLPISEKAIDESWRYPQYVESDIPIWAHDFGTGENNMYADDDLGFVSGNGFYHWCQETSNDNSSRRVLRGGSPGPSRASRSTSSTTSTGYGWSPVLELL